jgi:hypothetical protein
VLWVAGFRVEWWPAGALSVSWCAYLGRRADGYTLVEACTGQTRHVRMLLSVQGTQC